MKGKVILITGASGGIGKALADKFAGEGSKVALAARSADKLDALVAEYRSAGVEAIGIRADVSKQADCENMVSETLQAFGAIDVLINNAGISMRALFNDLEVEVLEKVMAVNFWGTVYSTKAALPHILASKGTIIGISSIAGYRGLPGRTGYSASKFAMQGFLESLRTELLNSGVNVMVACPGFTASNIRNTALVADGSQQQESPRDEQKMMTAEEVAGHIYNAVLKRKRSIVLTRQGKLTVFFNKWLPGWMDKKVFQHFAKEAESPLEQ